MSVLGHSLKVDTLNRTYAKGEKCATALFTEIDVGNEMPECFLDELVLERFFFKIIKEGTHL